MHKVVITSRGPQALGDSGAISSSVRCKGKQQDSRARLNFSWNFLGFGEYGARAVVLSFGVLQFFLFFFTFFSLLNHENCQRR